MRPCRWNVVEVVDPHGCDAKGTFTHRPGEIFWGCCRELWKDAVVRGMTDNMTIGERVAFYRNRRGMSQEVLDKWESYQQSRYSRLSRRLPPLVTDALTASQQYGADTDDGLHAHRLLASVYQLATGFLTKVGEADLASLSATKGLSAAHASGSELMIGSLYRSVAHALLAIGEYEQAVALTRAVSDGLQSSLGAATPEYLSVYSTL
jgi:hypothetical protein